VQKEMMEACIQACIQGAFQDGYVHSMWGKARAKRVDRCHAIDQFGGSLIARGVHAKGVA
jgi:hypothetical protein